MEIGTTGCKFFIWFLNFIGNILVFISHFGASMDAPTNTASTFKKNCDDQRAGYLSGVAIFLKKETEVDPSSPEANWRFDSNLYLVNRLNGRKVSVDDTETYTKFGSDAGYLKGDFDRSRKWLKITPVKTGTSTYYFKTSEGYIYANDSEKKVNHSFSF